MTDPLDDWDAWQQECRRRLDAGRLEYGDRSFSEDPAKLAEEIEQEAQDLGCWAFILSRRTARLRVAAGRLRDLEARPAV